jgi:hypothetical protein
MSNMWRLFARSSPIAGFRLSGPLFRSSVGIRLFSTVTTAVPYGWVYAFYSRSMPGLVKIGMTTRSPEIRLAEANKGDTWRPPEKYRILCALRVKDAVEKEKEIHAAFARERIGAREFFRLPHAVVLQYFKRQARITRF